MKKGRYYKNGEQVALITVSQAVYDNETGRTVKQDLDAIGAKIDNIENDLYEFVETAMTASSTISGKYLKTAGNTGDNTYASLLVFDVTGISTVFVNANSASMSSATARQYGFYSSANNISAETLVGTIGPAIMNVTSGTDVEVNVPSGAAVLVVTEFNTSSSAYFNNTVSSLVHGDSALDIAQSNRTNINALSLNVSSMSGDIEDNTQKLLELEETNEAQETQVSTTTGYYIKSSGNTAALTNAELLVFDVTNLESVTIKADTQGLDAILRQYAFYSSSSNFSSSTLVGEVGPAVVSANIPSSAVISVPSGAAVLVVTNYHLSSSKYIENEVYTTTTINAMDKANANETAIENLTNDVEEATEAAEAAISGWLDRFAYSYDGSNNFYIAYNDASGVEITYWFKKCMANNLYTFYRVGYRTVTRVKPSTEGIADGTGITYINSTGSDNIGPIRMTTGDFVGGNHLYNDETVKTAKTDSFIINIDGSTLTSSVSGFAKDITIKVNNIIYDPAIAPAEGDTILSTKLCDEIVTYHIVKNTIEVGLTLKFVSTTTNECQRYYGMQSMFNGEAYFLVPNSVDYGAWSSVSSATLSKADNPNVNRFIEKSSTCYQSTYLINTFSLGKHNNTGNVVIRTSDKCYHWLISNKAVANKTFQWAGSYTFFKTPLVDDGTIFAYRGAIRGKDVVFISAPTAFSGCLPIPSDLALKKVSVIENFGFTNEDAGTDFELGGDGIALVSSSAASMILQFD